VKDVNVISGGYWPPTSVGPALIKYQREMADGVGYNGVGYNAHMRR
jgi:hypothetical protein